MVTSSATGGSRPVLGRLEQVELRTGWTNEAGDFTPWLAREENLRLLSKTIGIDLELEAQEQSVGPFRADILCKDATTNHWVLIENQLERTNHGHLGQLLTYAAGLDAVTIIWIAAQFTDEHRAALDWLNEKTEESVNFFGLEIELWRIGDSPPAPKFNVVSKPNDWTATVSGNARRIETGEPTPTQELQRQYWEAFRQDVLKNGFLKPQKALPQYWMYFSIGRSGAQLMASVSSREPWIQVAFVLIEGRREWWFTQLRQQREVIEQELGFELAWENPPGGFKENRMAVRLHDADFRKRADWPQQHEWLRQTLESFHRVFSPRVKELPAVEGQPPADDGGPPGTEDMS